MTSNNKPTFIFFYSNDCQNCKDFMSDWKIISDILKSKYDIDVIKDNNTHTLSKKGIIMVPEFRYYPKGNPSGGWSIIYGEQRNVSNLVNFVGRQYNLYNGEEGINPLQKKLTLKDKIIMWNKEHENNIKKNLQTFFDNIPHNIECCIANKAHCGHNKARYYFPTDKGSQTADKLTKLQYNKAKTIAINFLSQEEMKFTLKCDSVESGRQEYVDIVW